MHDSPSDSAGRYHPQSLTRPPPSSASDLDEPQTGRDRAHTIVSVSRRQSCGVEDAPAPPVTDVRVRAELSVELHHAGGVSAVVCGEGDGDVLTGGGDKAVVRFDLQRRRVVESWKAHSMGVEKLLYSQSMKAVFSASRDSSIRLFALTPAAEPPLPLPLPASPPAVFRGHTLAVTALAFASPSTLQPPSVLISGSRDYTLRWWDIATQQQTGMRIHADNVVTAIVAAAAGGQHEQPSASATVLQGNAAGLVLEWDARSADVVHSYAAPPPLSAASSPSCSPCPVVSLSLHPSCPQFVVAHSSLSGSRLRLHDLRMRRVVRDTAVREQLVAAAHMPMQEAAEDRLVSCSRNRVVSLWSNGLCVARGKVRAGGSGSAAADSGDASCMALGSGDREGGLRGVAVYVGSSSGSLSVWDVRENGRMAVALQTRPV